MTRHPDLIAAGREIRRQRLLRSLSQEQLAERASLHRNYVGLLERGERNASLATLFALAGALGVSLSELFSGLPEAAAGTAETGSPDRPRRRVF